MLHGLLDKGTFKQAKVCALFVADDSVCDLIFSACIRCEVVKQRNMVSAQIRNRTADLHGYNTPFSISDYIPLQYGTLRKNRIKAEHRNSVFQGCCWELAHTVVQMHGLSCNMHYYTGT